MKPRLFNEADRPALHRLWDEILDSGQWTEGPMVEKFEFLWKAETDLPSAVLSSWSGGMMAVISYFDIRSRTIFAPANTFLGSLYPFINAGNQIVFVDANKADLCMSADELEAEWKIEMSKKNEYHEKPPVVLVAHIGGHICFSIDGIKRFCDDRGMILIEDCAHSAGAGWGGRAAGSWGAAGVFSLYATKSITTGEGGVVVSDDWRLIDYVKKWRKYGKILPNEGVYDWAVRGLNFQMDEFTAAVGVVQMARFREHWFKKRRYVRDVLMKKYPNHVKLPDGMYSGYYKFIVFDEIPCSTGKVYDYTCPTYFNAVQTYFPVADWIKRNHWCVPFEV